MPNGPLRVTLPAIGKIPIGPVFPPRRGHAMTNL